jgi:predicted 3-demethylubiquinone-9 3-methyltransferase (glyoxalase superfamily)
LLKGAIHARRVMVQAVTTFLMFEGQAEAALDLYRSLFPGLKVTRLDRYGPGEAGAEGEVSHGAFTLAGQAFRVFDSPVPHAFSFTPAVSIFVDCADEAELERLYVTLRENGQILMPLGEYGFSRRFGWVNDRFGVSWQLNLP